MKTFKTCYHYCVTAEYSDIPFRARSCGHYNVAAGYYEPPWRRDFIQLYWCIDGQGSLKIKGKDYPLHPGEICFYLFGDYHEVSCTEDFFNYRWMTFEGPAAMPVWSGLQLTQPPRQAGRCPEELFIQLEKEIVNYSSNGLRLASATAFRILMLAASNAPAVAPSHDYVEQARRVIDSQFSNPQLNIGGIADQLGVDRSLLSRKFHAVYGVTPVQYLINARIKHGMELLADSSLMIKEIAARSGFSDPNYFTKIIKKYTGNSVREYRKG
jgi:AraC-like DNA-binding protein